jgi:TetR/AcrR family tetracycline transcriptional repressor
VGKVFNRVLAILRAGGLPDELAVAAHQLLISIVMGFAIDETGEGGQPPADQPPPHAAAAMTRDYLASLPSDRFPHLVEMADHIATADADQRFELLLDVFVDRTRSARPWNNERAAASSSVNTNRGASCPI